MRGLRERVWGENTASSKTCHTSVATRMPVAMQPQRNYCIKCLTKHEKKTNVDLPWRYPPPGLSCTNSLECVDFEHHVVVRHSLSHCSLEHLSDLRRETQGRQVGKWGVASVHEAAWRKAGMRASRNMNTGSEGPMNAVFVKE